MEITTSKKIYTINAAKRPALTVTLFGAVHLLVDLASISTLYTASRLGAFSPDWIAMLILFYDYLAFASQLFIGYALDRLGLSGKAAALGCVITAAGTWLAVPAPVAAVVAVAIGNALFHVGGGAVCLRLDRGRAKWPGIFVAPGAIGLFLGKQIGGTALFLPWALTLLLCAGVVVGMLLQAPKRASVPLFPEMKGFGLVAAALIVTVALRSLVGFSVTYPWVAGWQQAVWLTLAVFAGKALGGALGDRLGWRRVTTAGLLVSAPLLALCSGNPVLAVAGVLCFNLTMAVTLAGLAYMLPGYEGLAFGFTATALVVGLSPTALPALKPALSSPYAIGGFILFSAAALWLALGRLEKDTELKALRAAQKPDRIPSVPVTQKFE